MAESSVSYEPICVARQPVFDSNMIVWGYELLFRHSSKADIAEISDSDVATSKVIADGFAIAQVGFRAGAKALINYPKNLILDEAPFALPPDSSVVEILETVQPEEQILSACAKLKMNGYLLALDDYAGAPGYEPLLEMADIVKVDVLGLDEAKIREISQKLKNFPCWLLAEKVENKEMYELTKDLGFQLFQGFFFSKPVIVPGRKLPSNQLAKLRLLNELSKEDYDFARMSNIIQTDLSLSYRLLRHINSPSFALTEKVESIQRAIAFMGKNTLLQWLRVVLMADLNPTNRGKELVHLSVHRAQFLKMLAQKFDTPFNPDSMFLFGFFSLLDAILDQPMGDLLKNLPLDKELIQAMSDSSRPEHNWIKLIYSLEKGDWQQANPLMDSLRIPPQKTAVLYTQALMWTQEMLQGITKVNKNEKEPS